ncbi:HDIG domain-containing protein [Candidatus Woesearchaeota archaeon]|nr:HDIG domain-containing protein [Candidatus Woesearchaeota archaeon]
MISEQEAIALLKKYAPSEELFQKILDHVKTVQRAALRIAEKCKDINLDLIRIGSLLHDIGRFETHSIQHGIKGAEIIRKEGLDEALARIAERHIGAGISKEDIKDQKLPLPEQDFIPETKEEKIIAHADNLIFGDREGTFEEVLERYKKELGEEHLPKFIKLKQEVESWMI